MTDTIARLESLLKKAAPLPWEFRATKDSGGIQFVVAPNAPQTSEGFEFIPADCSHNSNGQAICAAMNALPGLLKIVKAAMTYRSAPDNCFCDYDGECTPCADNGRALDKALAELEGVRG